MTTNVYAAKRAIFDRLQTLTAPGGPLAGVQVSYAFPGATLNLVCVYGGFVQFDQPGDEDAAEPGLVKEAAEIGLHIRVKAAPVPEDGVEHSDIMAEEIGEAIGALLLKEPSLCGPTSYARLVGGQASYELEDGAVVSTLSYRISVESWVT